VLDGSILLLLLLLLLVIMMGASLRAWCGAFIHVVQTYFLPTLTSLHSMASLSCQSKNAIEIVTIAIAIDKESQWAQ
jgi:hypothetical protein